MNERAPTFRRHRRSGHGHARLDCRQVGFGPSEDPETLRRFVRTLAEWIANGRRLPPELSCGEMRVADIVAAYFEFAGRLHSKPDGAPTREVENLSNAVRLPLKLYGTLPAHEFGLRQLKTLREQMITGGLTRKTIWSPTHFADRCLERLTSIEVDRGAAAACFVGQTFHDLYASVAPIFCGGGTDGGAADAAGD